MPTFYSLIIRVSSAQLLGCVVSCTVYAPMQPTMPLVQAVGQAEFGASLQPNGRLEATAAYAPVSHLLLMAGGTVCPKLGSNNFLVTRQYEVGAGGYLPLGTAWLLNGVGGYGQAVSNRGYRDLGLFLGSTYSEYHARYHKVFAQAGIAYVDDWRNMGFTYRLTQVWFSTLTDSELGKLPLPQMLRHEFLFFVRRPWTRSNNLESQVAMGMSVSSTPRRDNNLSYPNYGRAAYQANRNLLPAFYISLGLVYHPDWGGW